MNLIEALLWCEKVNRLCEKNKGWGGSSRPRFQTPQQLAKSQYNTDNKTKLNALKTISFAGGKMVPPDKGEALINENREVFCDYLQDTIKIDRLFTDHIKGKGKTRNDRRYGRAKFLLHTLRHPQEVWINDSNGRYKGRLTLISQFRDNTTGRVMSVYIVVARNKKTLTADFFMNDPDDINAKRNGRLLPPKKQGNG